MRTVRLGDVAFIDRDGVDPTSLDSETLYLGLEHIEKGGRILGYVTVGDAQPRSTKFRFTPQHVLFGKLRPNLGKVSSPTFEGICSTDILPIRPGSRLDRGFLTHYLQQPEMVAFAASRAAGANLPRLSPAVLAEFPVPLPPLPEQRRIAAILDHADALCAKRRQVLTHLDTLTQSIFHEMFGGAEQAMQPLSSLGEVTSGLTKGRKLRGDSRKVPYLAVANVQAGSLKLDQIKEIDASEQEIQRYALREGDVVLTEGGDPDKLGRGTVWRSELPLCLHQNHIFRVRLNGKVHPVFMSSVLASAGARNYFLRSAKQTTGIASINMTQLKALPVPVPSSRKQMEYVRCVDQVRVQRLSAERAAKSSDELFASLQSRAFSGEL